jgi:phospholipase C
MRPAFAGFALLLSAAACGQNVAVQTVPLTAAAARSPAEKIAHVVIIFQENRSTDDLFNGFPGADTVRTGLLANGKRVVLRPVSMSAPYDLNHTHSGFLTDYANGKMNGFNKYRPGCAGATVCPVTAYAYVPHGEIKPYLAMATQYAFADRMFQSNQGPSFPAHQYIVSGTSSIRDFSKLRAAENTTPTGGGCDSQPGTLVPLINRVGAEYVKVYPCFDRVSLMESLDKKGLSWRYYQAIPGPGVWNGPDAVLPIWESGAFSSSVVTPPARVLTDIARGKLANVVWVTPTTLASDHPEDTNGSGPSWVAAIVNAIGKSKYWKHTAIFVTWDDWGGWYDHVPPPQLNSYELGFRVPLIVISPYAKNHYVSHVQHEFGSILKFTEEIFGLPSLHTTDKRSDDLFDCFNFSKPPTKFKKIPAEYPPSYFFNQPSTEPDD